MTGMSEWLEGNQRTASAGTYTKGCVCSLVPCASLFCVSLNEMYLKRALAIHVCVYTFLNIVLSKY